LASIYAIAYGERYAKLTIGTADRELMEHVIDVSSSRA
jgi:hypothetical protein